MATIAQHVGVYKRSRSRSAHMRAHWHIAHILAEKHHQPIQYARKMATVVVHGGTVGGVTMNFRYQYKWRIHFKDGDTHDTSVVSNDVMGKRKQRQQIRKSYEDEDKRKGGSDEQSATDIVKIVLEEVKISPQMQLGELPWH